MLGVWLEPSMINEQLIKGSFCRISSEVFYFLPYIKALKTRMGLITSVYIQWGSIFLSLSSAIIKSFVCLTALISSQRRL